MPKWSMESKNSYLHRKPRKQLLVQKAGNGIELQYAKRSVVGIQMTLIWKDGCQVNGWVVLHDTGAKKASHQLIMVGLHARKRDGHQTHSVKG
ncbi:unnamed protein product [Arctogadus glacialis]